MPCGLEISEARTGDPSARVSGLAECFPDFQRGHPRVHLQHVIGGVERSWELPTLDCNGGAHPIESGLDPQFDARVRVVFRLSHAVEDSLLSFMVTTHPGKEKRLEQMVLER